MKNDAKVAQAARALAEALMDLGYSRKDDDKKRVTLAQTELCRVVHAETAEEPTDG